jgi:type I restriction enzyme S subunit
MKMVELGEFFPDRNINVDPAKFGEEEFELYSIPAYDVGEPEHLRGAEIGSSKKLVQPGDVLLSRIIPHIRRAWVVPQQNGARQIASSEWIVLRGGAFDPSYVRHFLLSDKFHTHFMQTVAGVGGSLLRARPQGVGQIQIPLPPLDEQRRIAAILDQADALRRARRRAIERLNDLGQAIFYEMFGDPVTNPKGWEIGTVGDLAESTQYGTSARAGAEGGLPILRMNNLTYEGEITTTDLKYIDIPDKDIEKYTVRDGDILFNRTNSAELVGKTAVYHGEDCYAFAGYLVRLRTNAKADPDYVSAFMNSVYTKTVLRSMCKSIIGMANINAREFCTIRIPIPPIDLQRNFSQRLSVLARNLESYRLHEDRLNDLFSSLQQRAFCGDL